MVSLRIAAAIAALGFCAFPGSAYSHHTTPETREGELRLELSKARAKFARLETVVRQQEAEISRLTDVVTIVERRIDGKTATVDQLYSEQNQLMGMISDLRQQREALYRYRYYSPTEIGETGNKVAARNNPFFFKKADIRKMKHSAKSLDGLWKSLAPIAEEYRAFGDRRDIAIGAMLVVGAFYDFGNPAPNDGVGGCVSINQNTNNVSIGDLTFDAMTKEDIGCCTDYTLMLGSFLTHLGFKAQAVVNGGHQALKVYIDSKWHYLDANTLIYGENFFSPQRNKFFYFTPYRGSRVSSFQLYVLRSLAFSLESFSVSRWEPSELDDHYRRLNAYFLTNASEVSQARPALDHKAR